MNSFDEAHLYVAAIRVLRHQHGGAPSLEELCGILGVSSEEAHTVCRSLHKKNIITILEDPFTVKLDIADYLAIEQLPKTEEKGNKLAEELAKFQEKKKMTDDKVAAIQAEMERKKKEQFSEIEARLKEQMGKYKNS